MIKDCAKPQPYSILLDFDGLIAPLRETSRRRAPVVQANDLTESPNFKAFARADPGGAPSRRSRLRPIRNASTVSSGLFCQRSSRLVRTPDSPLTPPFVPAAKTSHDQAVAASRKRRHINALSQRLTAAEQLAKKTWAGGQIFLAWGGHWPHMHSPPFVHLP